MYPIFNPYLFCYPTIPSNTPMPPTINDILNSIVNGTKENILDWVGTSDLVKAGYKYIFDFDFPLSENINKDEFEQMILSHFLLRRIGQETVTLFKIYLKNKLNEIMPVYNKMFDSMANWNIFEDGQIIEHNLNSTFTSEENRNSDLKTNAETNSTNTSNTEDRQRYSDTPQNQIEDIEHDNYMSDFRYNIANDTSTVKGNSEGTQTTKETNNKEDKNGVIETTKFSQQDKIKLYIDYQTNIKNIYSLIYKDLEPLFYQVIM